jgi:primosomal protein N'
MAIGSIAMWLGVPVFWVWLASQLSRSSQPSGAMILLIVAGIAGSMLVLARLLGRANHAHQVITGRLPRRRQQTVWMRSMRGEREVVREHGVLGTVMTVSVSLALIVLVVWFFFFAEGGGI